MDYTADQESRNGGFAADASAVANKVAQNTHKRNDEKKQKKKKKVIFKILVPIALPLIGILLFIAILIATPMGIPFGIRDNGVSTSHSKPRPISLSTTSDSAENVIIKDTGRSDRQKRNRPVDVAIEDGGSSSSEDSEMGKATDISIWADTTNENLGAQKHGFDTFKDSIVNFFKNSFFAFLTGSDRAEEMQDMDEAASLIIESGKEKDGSETEWGATTSRTVASTYKYFTDSYVDKLIDAKGESGSVTKAAMKFLKETDLGETGTLTENASSLVYSSTADDESGISTTTKNIYKVNLMYAGDKASDFFTPVFYLLAANSSAQVELGEGTTDEDYAMSSIYATAEKMAPSVFSVVVGTNLADIDNGEEPTFEFSKEGGPDLTETEYEYAEDGTTVLSQAVTNTYYLFAPYRIIAKDEDIVEMMIDAGAEDPENNERPWIEMQFERLCMFFGGKVVDELDSWARADVAGNLWSFGTALSEEEKAELLAKLAALEGLSGNQAKICALFQAIAYSSNPTAAAASMGIQVQGGFCQAFASDFLAKATGGVRNSYGSALGCWRATGGFTGTPPDGALVFANSSTAPQYGHVGIYCGGYVIDCISSGGGGKVCVYTFEQWKAQSYLSYLGWGTGGTDLTA